MPSDTAFDEQWWPRPKSRAQPRQTIDREQAVDAALALIERDGLEAFSMRKLAAKLGVGAPALYWHVVSREQLLSMCLERALRGFELPDGNGPWQEQLIEMAHRWWRHWAAKPRLASLLLNGLPPFPTVMRNGEWVAGILLEAGLAPAEVARALASWQALLLAGNRMQAGALAPSPDGSDATAPVTNTTTARQNMLEYVHVMLGFDTRNLSEPTAAGR